MKEKSLHVISLILIVTAAVAAWADKLGTLTFLPPAVAQYWPIVLAGAAALNRIALIVGDWLDDWKLNGSFVAFVLLGAAVVALATAGCVTTTSPDGTVTQRPDPKTVKVLGDIAGRAAEAAAREAVAQALEHQTNTK